MNLSLGHFCRKAYDHVASVAHRILQATPLLGAAMTKARNLDRFYLLLGFLLFTISFLINRVWFFLDYPVLAIHPDSGGYYYIVQNLFRMEWPKFNERSPLYPLFLYFNELLNWKAITVAYTQTFLTWLSCMWMIFAFYKINKFMAPLAALSLAGFCSSILGLEHDTSMLTESTYTSALIFSFAFLFLGLSTERIRYFVLASFFMACVILIRPAGQFLIVSFVMITLFMLWNRYSRRAIISFLAPFPLMLLLSCTYNYFNLNVFALTLSDANNVTMVTNLFWETDPSYPNEINDAIEKVLENHKTQVGEERMHLLKTSWDHDKLYPAWLYGHGYFPQYRIADVTGGWGTPDHHKWLMKLSYDAIKKHPSLFYKHLETMMIYYFKSFMVEDDFRAHLVNRIRMYYLDKHFSAEKGNAFMVQLGKEYADGSPPPKAILHHDENRVEIPPTPAWKLYETQRKVRNKLYRSPNVVYLYFFAIAASLGFLIYHRGRHKGAFMMFVMTISAFGAALIVSLVEYSQGRYSYPMEWTYPLSIIMLPLLLLEKPARSRTG